MIIEEIDTIRPVEALARVSSLPMPFIMQGMAGGPRSHTFVSAMPSAVVESVGAKTTVRAAGAPEASFPDPFTALSALMKEKRRPAGPFPFSGGFAGFLGYGLKSLTTPARAARRRAAPSLAVCPDALLGLYENVMVIDHGNQRCYLVSESKGAHGLSEIKAALSSAPAEASQAAAKPRPRLCSNTTREEFVRMVESAQRYISEGDIYQINLSQRLSIGPFDGPLGLWASLVEKSPAPFASYFDFGPFRLISNSPERLLKISSGVAETMPIKGTRPRGTTPDEDALMVAELKSSPKERAEHVMIVDLERNDLGRVCRAGSVVVAGFEAVETYPHLHHMVSTVRGVLCPGIDSPGALMEVFPGGSVTGAPKIRAIEIIDELEKDGRGAYTGGIGWFDLSGDADISMAIRTAVHAAGTLHLHVGSGIVADSEPGREFDETLLKAGDFITLTGAEAD